MARGNKKGGGGNIRKATSLNETKSPYLPMYKPPRELIWAFKHLNKENLTNDKLCNDYINLIKGLANVKDISPEHYLILFKIMLYLESRCYTLEAEKHNMMDQQLKSESSDVFIIQVPTLDEDDPFIFINDEVKISVVDTNESWSFRVIDVVNKKVYISPYDDNTVVDKDKKYNVRFYPTNWPLRCCHYVLYIMNKYKLVNLMFPKMETNHFTLPDVELNWFHESVTKNPEQKAAVMNILHNSAYPAPYIVFGPPGTGKTTTLVEAICQVREQVKSKSILVCAHSNAAADEITKRLLQFLPTKYIFRIYAKAKTANTIDNKLIDCSNFINGESLYLPNEVFTLKKIVITTLTTCIRLVNLNLRNDHFSHIFIDEASQSTELETLIPFTTINSLSHCGEMLQSQIIIAGDPYQLGPVVKCREIAHLFGKSLLERLMECEPYQKVDNKYNPRYITKLIRNFRSRAAILYTSNKLFYGDLIPCAKLCKITSNWDILSNRTFPIIFFAVQGVEVRAENLSVSNEKEALIVTYCLANLLKNTRIDGRKIGQNDIAIITPFREQKMMIENKLRNHSMWTSVGTIETFQGQEREVIILSTVRSETFCHNGKEHIGFLSNPKRFNVALTRAKQLLIIVGNPFILCLDKHWETLWQYCQNNNACIHM
ncbi:putative helicase mov-10-B.1 [Ceratina calcarata]|uniref:Helicase mov-10-B.1 n=1 Tax=Ceratina calcarata TaxID=156304 RepID=A0AAJ7N4I4_9HYME|nr:putative helicase mov-10-B.1 [Ceratina calcarata]